MEIWSFVNSKGGVGKSTLSVHIAHALMAQGKEVCIVDADPQGSIRNWQDTGQVTQFTVIGLDRRQALKSLPYVVDNKAYHYCLIDTPGRIAEIQAVAISLSKKIFIPVQPSPYDIWASGDVVELIKARQNVLTGLPECPFSAFIINRAKNNTIMGREVREALKEFDMPVCDTVVYHRESYLKSIAEGRTVISSKDKDSVKAKQEIDTLTLELQAFTQ